MGLVWSLLLDCIVLNFLTMKAPSNGQSLNSKVGQIGAGAFSVMQISVFNACASYLSISSASQKCIKILLLTWTVKTLNPVWQERGRQAVDHPSFSGRYSGN